MLYMYVCYPVMYILKIERTRRSIFGYSGCVSARWFKESGSSCDFHHYHSCYSHWGVFFLLNNHHNHHHTDRYMGGRILGLYFVERGFIQRVKMEYG